VAKFKEKLESEFHQLELSYEVEKGNHMNPPRSVISRHKSGVLAITTFGRRKFRGSLKKKKVG